MNEFIVEVHLLTGKIVTSVVKSKKNINELTMEYNSFFKGNQERVLVEFDEVISLIPSKAIMMIQVRKAEEGLKVSIEADECTKHPIYFNENKATNWTPAPEDVIDVHAAVNVNELEWQARKESRKDVEIATPIPKKGDIVVYWENEWSSTNRRWGIVTGFNTGICEIKRIEENGIIDHVLVTSIEQINPIVKNDFKIGDKIAYRKAGYDMFSYVDVVKDIGQAKGTLYVKELEDDEITEIDPNLVIKILDRAETEPEAPVIDEILSVNRGNEIFYVEQGIRYKGQVIGIYDKDDKDVYVVRVLDIESHQTHTIKLEQVLKLIH